MEIQHPKLVQFLNTIVANSANRDNTKTVAEIIADGLLVLRSYPENSAVYLYLMDEIDFDFRFSSSNPVTESEQSAHIFAELQEQGIIGEALSTAGAVTYYGSSAGQHSYIVLPLAVPTSVLGVIILENTPDEDPPSRPLLQLCELSANQFAYALYNTKLVQRLTYNQSVLEQKVSARTIHLEQMQRELKTILDSIQTGIVIIDAETKEILDANPAALEMMKAEKNAVIGKHHSEFFPQDELSTSQNTEKIESSLLQSDGESLPVIETSATIHLGPHRRIIHSFLDISVRKNFEDALLRANLMLEERVQERTTELNALVRKLTNEVTERERAEEAARIALEREKELSELKSNFVSMVSHEFRTPLTTILSYTQILQLYKGKWTEEDEEKYLKNIQVAVARMTDLLNDVLFIGSSNTGAISVNLRVVNLFELCNSVIEELRFTDTNKHTVNYKFDYLGSGLRTDEKLLRQIVVNLLSNAAKYSPLNTDIDVRVFRDNGHAVIEVQDRGIGIPAESIGSIFESFHRADNVGNISGTGLGLAIVKQSVDLLGGEISVESELNEGTTFTVKLPIQ
ncbi:MAG: PAS domain-containing sensor histidine kinase [Candidatus Kapaibacterium sp.]